ncbi:hypothetical protein [Spirillospora sp. CA-294931]|uniref:hypothetical protein n=1 Tax=Spirillospora sp. CA-294931 TaxID=3240042 RepID=UPI003D8BAE56
MHDPSEVSPSQTPDDVPRASPRNGWKRPAAILTGAGVLAIAVLAHPEAAAPVGVGLAAIEILHRVTRRTRDDD